VGKVEPLRFPSGGLPRRHPGIGEVGIGFDSGMIRKFILVLKTISGHFPHLPLPIVWPEKRKIHLFFKPRTTLRLKKALLAGSDN
jgi:hypothetical protein